MQISTIYNSKNKHHALKYNFIYLFIFICSYICKLYMYIHIQTHILMYAHYIVLLWKMIQREWRESIPSYQLAHYTDTYKRPILFKLKPPIHSGPHHLRFFETAVQNKSRLDSPLILSVSLIPVFEPKAFPIFLLPFRQASFEFRCLVV